MLVWKILPLTFFLLLLDIFPRQKLSQAMKSTVRGRQKQTVEQHDRYHKWLKLFLKKDLDYSYANAISRKNSENLELFLIFFHYKYLVKMPMNKNQNSLSDRISADCGMCLYKYLFYRAVAVLAENKYLWVVKRKSFNYSFLPQIYFFFQFQSKMF